MIKHFFSLLILTIFLGCSPIKKINSNVISGEFDKAINKTISELKKTKNKNKKKKSTPGWLDDHCGEVKMSPNPCIYLKIMYYLSY